MPPAGYPPLPGYGGGPGAGSPFSIGDAFSWSWGKFTKNLAAMTVPALIFLIGIGVPTGIMYAWLMGSATTTGSSTYTFDPETGSTTFESTGAGIELGAGGLILSLLVGLFLAVIGIYMQASFISGSLDIADGRPVTIGSFLKPRNLGPAILAGLLVLVGVAIGSALCVIPGLIFAFLAYFAIQFAIDRGLSPVNAVKASIATVRANLGPALLAWIAQGAVMFVGQLACGIGLVAAVPVAYLIQVYTYRKLTGGPVAPLELSGASPGPYPGPQYG
ncbi:hypothetical protein [Mycobacterium sp.]|uniref:hypothetical protein n=1 Tax=Mycobacterium sp. TaxID=1785 RepID=UPI003A83A51F